MATVAAPEKMRLSPLGRLEGDLDLRIEVTDNIVTNARTEASMFRGFEIILKGKDPQAGLVVTRRSCGGSHLSAACDALRRPVDPIELHDSRRRDVRPQPRRGHAGDGDPPDDRRPQRGPHQAGRHPRRPGCVRPDEAFVHRSPIHDPADSVEVGHVVRSYDSCPACTVHTYDGKTGRRLARFRIGEDA